MAAEMQIRGAATPQSLLPTGDPHYRFKDGIWEVIRTTMGWETTLAAARAIDVSDTTLSRALEGSTVPGERLMARLMFALPRTWKHDHVFELVLVDGDLAVPA